MQRRQHVDVDLSEQGVLLYIVVVIDGPYQVVIPKVWVVRRGVDTGIEDRVGVDVVAVDALKRVTEARRRLVVQVRPFLVGDKRAGDPLHPLLLGRRGQAELLGPGVEMIGEGHRRDGVPQDIVVLGLVRRIRGDTGRVEEERGDGRGVEVCTVRDALDATVEITRDTGQIGEPQAFLDRQAGQEHRVGVGGGHLVESVVETDCRYEGRGVPRCGALIENRRRDSEVIGYRPQTFHIDGDIVVRIDSASFQRAGRSGPRSQ